MHKMITNGVGYPCIHLPFWCKSTLFRALFSVLRPHTEQISLMEFTDDTVHCRHSINTDWVVKLWLKKSFKDDTYS